MSAGVNRLELDLVDKSTNAHQSGQKFDVKSVENQPHQDFILKAGCNSESLSKGEWRFLSRRFTTKM